MGAPRAGRWRPPTRHARRRSGPCRTGTPWRGPPPTAPPDREKPAAAPRRPARRRLPAPPRVAGARWRSDAARGRWPDPCAAKRISFAALPPVTAAGFSHWAPSVAGATVPKTHFRQARAWPYFRHRHGTGSSGPSRGRAPARARHARVARLGLRGDIRGVRASGAATGASDSRSAHRRHARGVVSADQKENPQQQDRLVAVRAQRVLRPGHLGGGPEANRAPLRFARLLPGPRGARLGHARRQERRCAEGGGR